MEPIATLRLAIAMRHRPDSASVSLRHVAKRFLSGRQTVAALKDVSFDISPGEVVTLLGSSGSGKSTVLSVVGGLTQADSGEVLVAGRDLREMATRELEQFRSECVGFVFQKANLVPVLTAVENVELGMLRLHVAPRLRSERAREWLARVGLADQGPQRAASLSGGEQQRVAVARALAAEPAIVLADEPTASLDLSNALRLLDLLREINTRYKSTFLIATHDPRVNEYATRSIRIEDGYCA